MYPAVLSTRSEASLLLPSLWHARIPKIVSSRRCPRWRNHGELLVELHKRGELLEHSREELLTGNFTVVWKEPRDSNAP